ncbi:MAG TPA: hypothetical protein VMO17_22510 [Terriglobia bacterium]|nr:hypothetical protein [Terriglobia bacterium]
MLGEKQQALGLVYASQAMDPSTLGEINDFDGVILEGSDEEFARSHVNCEMVEAALHAFEGHAGNWDKRSAIPDALRDEAGGFALQKERRQQKRVPTS